MAVSSIAFLNMIESRMAKPFMCLLMSEAIEAIVKVKRKNDCNFFKDCAMAMWIVMAFFFFYSLVSSTETPWLSMTQKRGLKQFVYALFTQTWKKELRDLRNSLIFSVDQLGLEPRTSRLWVCCSNQLSYKSDLKTKRPKSFVDAKVVGLAQISKFFL